jgi:DNA-binding response OmpR family regulator
MRVLVVEDDASIAAFISRGLREAGFAVDVAGSGDEALLKARVGEYDAAVMDVMLPGKDGLAVISELRRSGLTTPVLVLTARRSVEDRVRGLELGADDYLVKPFAFPELLARVQALIRRSRGTPEDTRLQFADLELDRLSRKVERGGREIELRPREFALLDLLLRNPGRVISKTMILSHVWGYDFDPGSNVVDVLVFRLRDKIDRGHDKPLIHTVRGVGYVLKLD